MMMVGAKKVFELGEIFDLGAIAMGVGKLNEVMDARPVFWIIPDSLQCFVSFVKAPACWTDLHIVARVISNRHAITLEVAQADVSPEVVRAFRDRLRSTEKLSNEK